MNLDNYFCSPLETWNGGFSFPLMVSSTSKKGFSPYTSVYNVTPRDHISNSGPSYLKINSSDSPVYQL